MAAEDLTVQPSASDANLGFVYPLIPETEVRDIFPNTKVLSKDRTELQHLGRSVESTHNDALYASYFIPRHQGIIRSFTRNSSALCWG